MPDQIDRPALRVFISYRRADSPDILERLFSRLEDVFFPENVFRDVESISAGDDFRTRLLNEIKTSTVFLCVIGPNWNTPVSGTDSARGRLFLPDDIVRMEIKAALDAGLRIVPVLVGGASFPPEGSIPAEIQPLLNANAIEVRSGRDFPHDFDIVVKVCWETRRFDSLFARGLTIPDIPASLIAPLTVLVHSADWIRGGLIQLLSADQPERIFAEHIEAFLAADKTIDAWKAFLGETDPPELENYDLQALTFSSYESIESLDELLRRYFRTSEALSRLRSVHGFYNHLADAMNKLSREDRDILKRFYMRSEVVPEAYTITKLFEEVQDISDYLDPISAAELNRHAQMFSFVREYDHGAALEFFFESIGKAEQVLGSEVSKIRSKILSVFGMSKLAQDAEGEHE
jgi:hypothetical protein